MVWWKQLQYLEMIRYHTLSMASTIINDDNPSSIVSDAFGTATRVSVCCPLQPVLQDDVQTGTELASGGFGEWRRSLMTLPSSCQQHVWRTALIQGRTTRTAMVRISWSEHIHKHQIDAITMAAPRLGCFPHSRFKRRNLHPWPGDANVASALMEI